MFDHRVLLYTSKQLKMNTEIKKLKKCFFRYISAMEINCQVPVVSMCRARIDVLAAIATIIKEGR